MKNKLLLVDLDDTLCNTRSFKRNMFTLLAHRNSIPLKDVIKIYEDMKMDGPLTNGWVNIYTQRLSRISGKSKVKLFNSIYESVSYLKLNKRVLDYAVNTKGQKLIITLGDKYLQKKKIEKLNLSKYFDGIIYIAQDKELYMLKHIRNGKFHWRGKDYGELVLIDDKPKLLKKLNKFHWIKIIEPKYL